MIKIFSNIYIILFLIGTILVPCLTIAYTTDLHPVTISAYVGVSDPNSGGGGGGGGNPITINTTVNFSGMAYPLSRVYILKDGQVAATTIADPAANFSVSLSGLKTNNYTFSVYSEDSRSNKSSFFSFPIYVTSGTTINIGNIFLSPTIDVDKSEVKQGDNIIIFGQSVPEKEIVISVHSAEEHFFKVNSNKMGGYLYNMDTSFLELGKHETKSKTVNGEKISLYTTPVPFKVGLENKLKDPLACGNLRGDLNCDNHVSIIDFSIMAYWYKKINPPQNIDLNKDGIINLVDFSIMAFNWTG